MSTETKLIRFTGSVGSAEFAETLSNRVNEYFRQQKRSKYGDYRMISKTIFGVTLWMVSYAFLISDWFSPTGLIGIYLLHGFAQLHMGLNIAHDANHDAYSKNKRVNRVLSYAFDLVGLSSYMWRLQHNDSHHSFVNVLVADTSVGYDGLFRVSPRMKRRWYHRYQHIYAPIIYCLATIDWVFAKDFRSLLDEHFGNHTVHKHPRKELVILFTAKAFYFTYTLVLPLIFLSVPWYSVLLAFFIMHLCIGFVVAMTFQPNHFTEHSSFAELNEDGHIENNYIKHVFENTADYGRGNPLMCWAIGGLNLHMVHHMYPKVCHVHYPALTEILRTTAKEYGFVYSEHKTLTGAFIAHLRWMRTLGREDRNVVPQRTDNF